MRRFYSPLDNLKVASPCSANWDEMYGDDRKRFCADCKLNVYNLSGMSRADAERLIMGSEGRLCVRFFRRADGSVITGDCPVGWARVKQRLTLAATAVMSLLITFLSGVLFVSAFSRKGAVELPLFPRPEPREVMGAIPITDKVIQGDINR